MAKYRNNLPLFRNEYFLTDGGLETVLIFHESIELPQLAAFTLLETDNGRRTLGAYFQKYVSIAKKHKTNFLLESPTWRASSKWGDLLGYSSASLEKANQDAINLLVQIRDANEDDNTRIVISGCIGPKGDGYFIKEQMSVDQAEEYHLPQITTFSKTQADLVTSYTLTHTQEAIGIVRAAKSVKIPVVIGFTVETDGRLPSGETIKDAVNTVDEATDNYSAYYMINCAHPTHFQKAFDTDESWKQRIRCVRANASAKSHAELDEAEELDDGDPIELGRRFKELKLTLDNLNVIGGCCGTDHRHVEAICKAVIE